MLIFMVLGESIEQAGEVAAIIQVALDEAPAFADAVPAVITPEVIQSLGILRYPAIVKDRVVLWEGSIPPAAVVHQWIEESYAQCDQVSGAQGEFGYALSNPIPADGNWYCRRLRCPSGHPFWYHRLGSVGTGPDGHIVDRLHLVCFGRESEVVLYFDMYHEGHSSWVPDGLTWDDMPSGRGTTGGRVVGFPDGLQDK